MPETAPFVFVDELRGPNSLVLKIPTGIASKRDLMETYAALGLPDYFGMNWDALIDCLGDFHWVEAYEIILQHEDLPLKQNVADLSIYLSVLWDAVMGWHGDEDHRLVVLFPTDVRDEVLGLARPFP